MKNKIFPSILALFMAGDLTAKQWVIVPLARNSQKPGAAAMAAVRSMALSASIGKLDIHKTAHSDSIPVAPLGYSVEEIKPVNMFSNDPHFSAQWNLSRVMAARGWNRATPISSQVVVAVVDTGIDATHPDLAGQVLGGANFVDNGSGAAMPSGSWADDHSHGTFCASLIAAVPDNGVGMAGIGRAVKLLAIKVLDARGSGNDFDVAQGMVWAVDQGAKVLSISLGTNQNSNVLEHAVQYARDNGVLVVAASGNSGLEEYMYPGAISGVLCVGSSTRYDSRAPYSTYNSAVGMVAPGGDALDPVMGAVLRGGYSSGAGTSFACPQVAGAAATYLAIHPGRTGAQAFAALTGTADPIDMAAGKSRTTGWGRLNLARLLGEDVEPNVFAVNAVSGTQPASGAVISALVGAGEPMAPSLSNPDPSRVDKVWAIVMYGGNELVREELASMGGNDWTAQVSLPAWLGTSSRNLSLGYQAIDSSGHRTAVFGAGSVVQAAGSMLPAFSHTPAISVPSGKTLLVSMSQYPAQSGMTGWTLHARTAGGDWQTLSMTDQGTGSVDVNVPAEWVKEERFEYYFSCVDAGGMTINIHGVSDPYTVVVYTVGEPMKLKHLANPSTELCVRLVASQTGVAIVDFYSISGEKVGGLRVDLSAGENRVCLGQSVASGIYFGVARMEGNFDTRQIKLAIK